MSFIFALFQKVSDLFASPHLPLDSDYSYEARSRDVVRRQAERLKSKVVRSERGPPRVGAHVECASHH
jgi:hypothetical protein